VVLVQVLELVVFRLVKDRFLEFHAAVDLVHDPLLAVGDQGVTAGLGLLAEVGLHDHVGKGHTRAAEWVELVFEEHHREEVRLVEVHHVVDIPMVRTPLFLLDLKPFLEPEHFLLQPRLLIHIPELRKDILRQAPHILLVDSSFPGEESHVLDQLIRVHEFLYFGREVNVVAQFVEE